MIRTLWVLLAGSALTLVLALSALAGRAMGRCVCDRNQRLWARGILRLAGARVTLTGAENLPAEVPVVIVANHQSWFDVFAMLAVLPAKIRFVAKEELGRIPIFGAAWRGCGHISVNRSDRRQAIESLDRAALRVREEGLAMALFPEGTRSPDGRLGEFRKGAFVLALKTEVPILPVGISGSRGVMPKGSFRTRRGEVRIRIGELIPTTGADLPDRDGLLRRARGAVLALMEDGDATAS